MTNERCYFAQKDFEAYNPHHDLKNPIKIKKYDLLLCNGGMPEQMLHDNGVIEEKQSFYRSFICGCIGYSFFLDAGVVRRKRQ